SLAIPKDFTDDALEALYEGLGAHARAHNVVILGGDTTRSLGPLIINIAVVGEVPEGEVLLRSGAREGDRIFVSGPLGDAAAGLHALFAAHNDDLAHRLTKRHQAPRPRLTLGRALAATGQVHAAIDLSDGLSTDLGHILHRSAVGAIVNAGAIPLSDDLQSYGAREGLDTIRLALDGGEDYELLICGDASLGEHFAELSDIGEIVASKEPLGLIRHPDGTTEPLTSQGWDPFSKEI
ncbi:MAG: thiamine-phosphate kinase, partial [Deltaproteobacteria bacterium]|nr:thiamine-phosphate kinase [Deltaproteobacteria bacterium]